MFGRLFTEAWIETDLIQGVKKNVNVASSRRRGLKPVRLCHSPSCQGRLFTEAWIETNFFERKEQQLRVASSRRRGLKHRNYCGLLHRTGSPLHGGVDWNTNSIVTEPTNFRRLFTEAWIETSLVLGVPRFRLILNFYCCRLDHINETFDAECVNIDVPWFSRNHTNFLAFECKISCSLTINFLVLRFQPASRFPSLASPPQLCYSKRGIEL